MAHDFFSRDEVLGGLSTKRARTLLYLIESKTAQWVTRSRRAAERFLTEQAAEERDLAFIEAFAQEKELPIQPSIQDLEKYAPRWQHLVPETPQLRAALVKLMAEKYSLVRQTLPNLITALSLDAADTQQAYQALFQAPMEAIYQQKLSLSQRLRWAMSSFSNWLENLSPFWIVFALTVTETMGAGILALPIALAGVGPLPGIVLMLVVGAMNMLTIAFMAESVARNGIIRYGSAFIGRVVKDYLGNVGSKTLLAGLVIICFFALLAYYVGLSTTLEAATGIVAEGWVAALFAMGIFFITRESMNSTIASSLLIGFSTIGLILLISLLALPHVNLDNLSYVNVPFINDAPFDAAILGLIFGVVIASFFGHLSVSNCAQVVLHRDPTGRTLIWGSVAAQVVVLFIYCVWTIAVQGSLEPGVLIGESSTALVPLAEKAGPLVEILGVLFVLLAMAMASIHYSLGLYNLVSEQIPRRQKPVVMLPRRKGHLILKQGAATRISLTYLGMGRQGQPQVGMKIFHQGKTHRSQITLNRHWDIRQLKAQMPSMDVEKIQLDMAVLEAHPSAIQLHISSNLAMSFLGEWSTFGFTMADVLDLPEGQQKLMNWLIRQGEASLSEAAHQFQLSESDTQQQLKAMMELGFVQQIEMGNHIKYQPLTATRRSRRLPGGIWDALDLENQTDESPRDAGLQSQPSSWLLSLMDVLGKPGRFILASSPVVMAFVLTEWLLLSGLESFSEPLSFLGIIVIALLGGIFPVFLLASGRKKGASLQAKVLNVFAHPLITGSIYIFSLSSLLLHGLLIWESTFQRISALAVAAFVLWLTYKFIKDGAFRPRILLELRQHADQHSHTVYEASNAGQAVPVQVHLNYGHETKQEQNVSGQIEHFDALQQAAFEMDADRARELKVWAHRVDENQESVGLPAELIIQQNENIISYDLSVTDGEMTLPLGDEETVKFSIFLNEGADKPR